MSHSPSTSMRGMYGKQLVEVTAIGQQAGRDCVKNTVQTASLSSRTHKSFMLGSGNFLVTMTGLLSAAVLARIFTKQDYATYRQTLLAYNILTPIMVLGLPRALYYFLPLNPTDQRRVLSGNLLLLLIVGIILTAIVWCGGHSLFARKFNNPSLGTLLLIYSPYALLSLPLRTIDACLVSCNRVKTLAVFNVVSKAMLFVCCVGLTLLWPIPAAAVVGTVVASAIVFVPGIWLMYGAVSGTRWVPRLTDLLSQIRYSIPLGLAGIVGAISLSLDKMIVSTMCEPDEFAVYVNGAMEIPLVGIVTVSVTSVLLPDLVRHHASGDYDGLIQLWHRAMFKCLTLFLPVAILIIVMAPEFVRILYGSEYEGSAVPLRVYAIRLPIRATTFGAILMAIGKTQMVTLGAVFSLAVNGLLSIILVRVLGAAGAAWATTATVTALALCYVVMISRCLGIKWTAVLPWRRLGRLVLATVPATAVVLLLAAARSMLWTNDVLQLLIVSSVFVLILVISYHAFGIWRFPLSRRLSAH